MSISPKIPPPSPFLGIIMAILNPNSNPDCVRVTLSEDEETVYVSAPDCEDMRIPSRAFLDVMYEFVMTEDTSISISGVEVEEVKTKSEDFGDIETWQYFLHTAGEECRFSLSYNGVTVLMYETTLFSIAVKYLHHKGWITY